ncbi:DUF3093 domain-containing protein [Amnibacterium flavum]|uniref:DUF3093 domain-containing protein n=1 Tax=Amnibacterium flavum TaxID=2173173 RepID=A0A2V1HTB7_9MICO|nr:DUF3093 domain-containing protein [Amnibacterium flavum]PVZ94299.1 DUF3093 domain-containing protein [Amnibacterium flavum]
MTFSERLVPSPWVFVACALLIPAGLLVFLPVSIGVAIGAAVVFFGGACAALLLLAPVVEVRDGMLRAGRARIPLDLIAGATAHRKEEATAERGVRLDARAYLCIRGWVDPIVKVELADPDDPAPYWIVSSRRPDELVAAITAGR